MAIHFETKTPRKLLKAFKKAIDDGHVVTWSYDEAGDFTHTPDQWANKAWLRPNVVPDTRLTMTILSPSDETLSTETYAIYHGRFIESALAHCDSLFIESKATAMPTEDDVVG